MGMNKLSEAAFGGSGDGDAGLVRSDCSYLNGNEFLRNLCTSRYRDVTVGSLSWKVTSARLV